MQNGLVMDENGQAVYPDRPYQANLKIFYYRAIENEVPIPFEENILFQDAIAHTVYFYTITVKSIQNFYDLLKVSRQPAHALKDYNINQMFMLLL